MHTTHRRVLAGLSVGAAALSLGVSSANAAGTAPATHTRTVAQARYTATQVADNAVRAWGSGNRAAASVWMTKPAADALFRLQAKGGTNWYRASASSAMGKTVVTYRDRKNGSTLRLTVINSRLATSTHAVQYVYLWRR